jgi:2-C-methyl-D-erythritol 2,4-cyclodiphosphate synthase
LIHALCDALLGALALGDIGTHFPDTDPEWQDADSVDLLRRVAGLIAEHGHRPNNVDCMLILERPKIGPYREQMRLTMAEALGMPVERVSVKATTHEKLGPLGAAEGVAAYAVATLVPIP